MAKRQQSIPGTERSPENPDLEEKCEDLRLLRAERIEIQQKEKGALDALLAYRRTMTTPVEVYRYPDEDGTIRVARFKPVIKVSVRSEKSDDADDSNQDDGSGDDDDGGASIQ